MILWALLVAQNWLLQCERKYYNFFIFLFRDSYRNRWEKSKQIDKHKMDLINSWVKNQITGSDSWPGLTQLSGLFWLPRHFGQTVRLCVGTCQWQLAAGRAVGGVASDQLWHAVCIWTNADMLTHRVPNSRARQSANDCPLSAGELDRGGTVLFFMSRAVGGIYAHGDSCVFDQVSCACFWSVIFVPFCVDTN